MVIIGMSLLGRRQFMKKKLCMLFAIVLLLVGGCNEKSQNYFIGTILEITDNESLFSDTLQDSKNSEIIERSKCISHFFPFCQQLIQDLCIGGRSAVQQYNRTRLDPSQKFLEGFFF